MTKNNKVVIVDDESKMRQLMKDMVQRYCPDMTVCGMAASTEEAFEQINQFQPDLVFLDIEMPDGSGFDLIKMFDKIDFSIIFVTAYDQYALKAIKFSALDYLLKPVSSSEFVSAVNKFRENRQQREGYQYLLENLTSKKGLHKIAIHSISKIDYVDLEDIVRLTADGAYTHIHLVNGRELVCSKTLKHFDKLLTEKEFFRLTRSHIINLRQVIEYIKSDIDIILFDNGQKIEISRKNRQAFMQAMKMVRE